ncbi:MAG: Glu-tRNA(Gln) amidotransferase subunit GatE [Thaumarchaeota archaeon]|nr:Glu-tRNA(Gln) amidotransferase subunit GatE [Nitrososphaerota archaeon]MBT4676029.1 Glu-tRNA(Gln) amidotransferase subunit GatE [Nitrososphaerota archaeon]MBT4973767.1 Glu-tRNA(Gln) amidotransferase subunit GatE [Nitrososphaerota archaeon]MBT5238224.1 Glu-tRNA(Gln) amidotransferase subunit GatE [Nitrososphaerota archaeon]MBT5992793.1 Glu-tRNA(Gln) amidotransferase subunit GatE [Nitrososphaerota archaeon]
MSELDIKNIGLKVGLEIHQQLDTKKKLFCDCTPIEEEEFSMKFSRKLRAAKSELGKIDPAALFESTKSKTIVYYANPKSSCLVEEDEEPPHALDTDAKNIVLLISSALESKIFSEIHVMRKTVIDGSNTTGFQRTMLVAQGGHIEVNGKKVGVQSICLEEDAGKLIKDEGNHRFFSLDRLGVPLIEIALDPVEGDAKFVKDIALTLGRLLRVTKKVMRGIGTIRQDVNISVEGGGVIEVKGVQQLDQLEKIIEFEAKRQHGLKLISEKINQTKFSEIDRRKDVFDITEIMQECNSNIIKKSIEKQDKIFGIRIKKLKGILGFEPYSDIRLGKEIGQLVRFFGIGGVFHSDELPNYGIENADIKRVTEKLDIQNEDAFLIIAGGRNSVGFAIDSIINRIKLSKNGPPAETRAATPNGDTIFLRPRPGASRMYPETDIPTVKVTDAELIKVRSNIPKSWEDSIKELEEKYRINNQLAEQIFDSEYFEIFEQICSQKQNSPNFVVSILCSTITNLERSGLNSSLLSNEHIKKTFELLEQEKINKESIQIIFEQIMSKKANGVLQALENASISQLTEDELDEILNKIIQENIDKIKQEQMRALSGIMGIAMKEVRGKASGKIINQKLKEKIQNFLN